MKRYYPILGLLLGLGLCSCGEWSGDLPEHGLVRINDVVITVEEFNREFKELILEPENPGPGRDLESLKRSYLDQVVERKILAQEARRLGVMISEMEMNQALLEIRKDYPGEGFGERLGQKGITIEQWKGWLEEKLLAEKMMRSTRSQPRKISEQEILQFYEANRSLFQMNERVRARQIVVSDGEEALQLLKRLKKGNGSRSLPGRNRWDPKMLTAGISAISAGEKNLLNSIASSRWRSDR